MSDFPVNNGFAYRSRVASDDAGLAVAAYLAQRYPRFSFDAWVERANAGHVLINHERVTSEARVQAGDVVIWSRPPWEEPPAPTSFAVLYHAHGLLGVAKPSGLPTAPAGGRFLQHTLLSLVRRRFPGANPLHRLGRATSGVVLFATENESAAALSREWRSREVEKVYRALIWGRPTRDEWTVEVPIGPVPHQPLGTVHAASPQGKASHSEVTVLERRANATLVQVRITTGRPHQIRIHLAASGHPLVGDPLYPDGGVPAADSRALPGDGGYFLHAEYLRFVEPATREWTEIFCLPPPVLRRER